MRSLVFRLTCLLPLMYAGNAGAQHYGDYHRIVNSAEEQLVRRHPDSALRLYRQAFAQYEFVFGRDAVIAAQVSLRRGRRKQADSFLMRAAAGGLQVSCIERIPLLRDYLHSKISGQLRQKLRTAAAGAEHLRDKELAAEWAGRFEEEQTAKNHPGSFSSYRDVVQRNITALQELWTKRHLFPGDRALGPGRCEDMGNLYGFYTLAHYDCAASAFEDMLWSAVTAGMLHPRDFAAIWEFERLRSESVPAGQRTNTACHPVLKKFNLVWFHETDPASRAAAARNRVQYWVRSQETDSALKALEKTAGYRLHFGYR